jgi:hypothetical protein
MVSTLYSQTTFSLVNAFHGFDPPVYKGSQTSHHNTSNQRCIVCLKYLEIDNLYQNKHSSDARDV